MVVATNSPDQHLIRPTNVKRGAIVCGASVPSNLSPEFAAEPDKYTTFDGGLARLPDGSRIEFAGLPADGQAYGCMAETLALGFEGEHVSFCKGQLSLEQVYQAAEMARRHGFGLADPGPQGCSRDRHGGVSHALDQPTEPRNMSPQAFRSLVAAPAQLA